MQLLSLCISLFFFFLFRFFFLYNQLIIQLRYQSGPDTYLLPHRDVDFPLRIREYLRVGASRSPSLANSLRSSHWGDTNVSYKRFLSNGFRFLLRSDTILSIAFIYSLFLLMLTVREVINSLEQTQSKQRQQLHQCIPEFIIPR